jgi:hypothetical protein
MRVSLYVALTLQAPALSLASGWYSEDVIAAVFYLNPAADAKRHVDRIKQTPALGLPSAVASQKVLHARLSP